MARAPSNTRELSLSNYDIFINGHEVLGLGSGSPFTWSQINNVETDRGAQGTMLSHRTGNIGSTLTVQLMPNAPSLPQFIAWANDVGSGKYIPFSCDVFDNNLGITTEARGGVLAAWPASQDLATGTLPPNEFMWEFESVTRTTTKAL